MFGSVEAQLLSDEPAVYSGDETNEDSMQEVDYYREQGGESLDLEEKPDIKTLGVQPEQDANVNQTSGKNNQISLRQTITLIGEVKFSCSSIVDITVLLMQKHNESSHFYIIYKSNFTLDQYRFRHI